MSFCELQLTGDDWFNRWEDMMNAYTPHRQERFNLLIKFPDFANREDLRILDLGCGPGSLAFHAIQEYPRARVTGVDFDPLLLAIGCQHARKHAHPLELEQGDMRQDAMWRKHLGEIDLVVSATALHWMTSESHRRVYLNIFRSLRTGGWFLNADHVAADTGTVQQRYRSLLEQQRTSAFEMSGACHWDEFWALFNAAHPALDVAEVRQVDRYWEGNDDDLPRSFHLDALADAGFDPVEVIWQDLGEAIIAARKPAA